MWTMTRTATSSRRNSAGRCMDIHDGAIATAQSEYFMMRSTDLRFEQCHACKGKYSFQYIETATFEQLPLRHQGRVLARQERGGARQRGQGRVPRVVLRERNL